MTVLVTGGAGFIGSHLVRLLIERGEAVRVLERPGAAVGHLPLGRIEVVRADVRDRAAVGRAVRGCREVYHLAANPNLWVQPRGLFHEVNYRGAVHVLEAALEAGARRVLHTSTESILTRARQNGAITEEQHVAYEDVIGPGDRGRSPPTQMILDFCRGKRREYLEADLNLIDVRDVAEGMVLAMARGRPGRRYLLGHENLSIYTVFAQLGRITGRPPPRWRVPYALALTVAYASEFLADVLTHRMPAATVTGVKLTRRRMHFDARRSLDELGLRPRPVAESLADAVAWFREQGWLK